MVSNQNRYLPKPIFAAEKQAIAPVLQSNRNLIGMLFACAVAGVGLPALLPQMPKPIETVLVALAPLNAIALTVVTARSEHEEELNKAIQTAELDAVKQNLTFRNANHQIWQRIYSEMEMRRGLAELPQPVGDHYRAMLGLAIQQRRLRSAEPVEAEATVVSATAQQPLDAVLAEPMVEADYGWLDPKFIRASKAVFGPKGSGKSFYLTYEAVNFLDQNPNGQLYIVDRHYDPEDPATLWLPGVPPEELMKRYLVKKSQDGFKFFQKAKQTLLDRINRTDGSGKKEPPFKLICDEFEGFLLDLTKSEAEEVQEILGMVQDEGRKFNVDITLGMHSIKKGRVGIDSSILFQMDVLCLGSALADPATQFPRGWECDRLLADQRMMQASLQSGQGFACVVARLGEEPMVQVLPHIHMDRLEVKIDGIESSTVVEVQPEAESDDPWEDLPQVQPGQDPIAILQTWVETLNDTPTDEQIANAWREITGVSLSEGAIAMLREKLGI